METDVTEFLNFLTVERQFSQNTLAAYRNDLFQFIAYLRIESPAVQLLDEWAAVSSVDADNYLLSLRSRNYADATVARKVAALKSFFRFLRTGSIIASDPTEKLECPKVGKAIPKAVSVGDVSRLLEQPMREATPEAKRDKAMLELLYATGMRVSELVALNQDDINLLAGFVRCIGKRRRERVLPVPGTAADAVRLYLEDARPVMSRSGLVEALFVNHRGERLTRQGFWLIIKSHARSARLGDDISPHTLRHSLAAHRLAEGADLKSIQELLGHASITSTQIYERVQTVAAVRS